MLWSNCVVMNELTVFNVLPPCTVQYAIILTNATTDRRYDNRHFGRTNGQRVNVPRYCTPVKEFLVCPSITLAIVIQLPNAPTVCLYVFIGSSVDDVTSCQHDVVCYLL